MTRTVKLGLLGCGVVGGGVVEALQQCRDRIAALYGIQFDIVRIAVRDLQRDRVAAVRREWLCNDWQDICEADDVDVVVEVMGGLQPAQDAIATALRNGKHVVTANKELLASCGEELHHLAEENGCHLLYEASVLGGVPVLHGIETYFQANQITRIRGILNGTCNYILSRMAEGGVRFADALSEAQASGYAEADPTMDVESLDALFKLEILTRLAFGAKIDVGQVSRVGIAGVEACDMSLARQLGCRIQQVAIAEWVDDRIAATVEPTFVPQHDPLSHIAGVDNGLSIEGSIVGRVLFSGPGAGAFPTASAVVEDLMKLVTAVPNQTRTTVSKQVTHVEAPAYFVRRRCARTREWLGPLATGSIGDGQIRIGGYARTSEGTAEGWVLFCTRSVLQEVIEWLRAFDGSPIVWYPFTEAPKACENSIQSGATPQWASV
jgi:homoserine dehydrogenase